MADLKLQVILSAIDRATAPLRKIMSGSSSTAQALKAARLQLRDLDRAQNQVQGFRRLSAQTTESGIAMKAAYQHAARLKAEMAATDAPTQKAARAMAKAEREAVKLKNAHIGNLRALKESKAELASTGIAINRLAEHERKLRVEMSRTTQVIDKQQLKLDRLAKRNQQLYLARRQLAKGQGMASAAASGGASLGAAGAVIGAPVLVSIKAYSSFEDAMTGVARQVQGARDGTGKLTPLYYELGESIKSMAERIPMATTDIAALIEAGARMGIQGKKNLLTFAETTAITAAAFELPVDEVGENMGKLSQLYKIPISSINQLGDVINYLDDNALSKGGEIIDVMQRLGGVADKLDFRKAAALGSTFLSLGAAPEIAASASNAMVRELSIATMQSKRFRKGLETLGLDARKLQDRMAFDATGTIISVLEQIKSLKPSEQMTVATQLFGKEFGDDAAKLANNLSEYRKQLALVQAAEAKGSMQREASARLRNLSAGWQLLKSTAFNAAADMGATLAPSLLDVMQRVRGMLGSVRTWIKENPALASTILKATAAIAVLLATVGSLAIGVAGVIGPLALVKYSATTLGIGLQPVLRTITSLGTRALPMLANGARMLLPILGGVSAPVMAIVAAVAVAGVLIWKYWQPIKAFMVGLWQGISEAAAPIGAQLAEAFAPLRPVFDWLGNVLSKVWGWIKQFLTPFQATNEQLQNATNYGRAFGQVLGTVILAPLRLVIGAVGFLWKAMKLAFEYSPIGVLIRNWSAITGFLSGLWQRFKDIGAQLMQGLIGGLLGGLKAVRDTITGVGGQVVGWFKQKLGIHSPSRVFAQLGDYTMQGLAGGLERSRSLPMRSLTAVAGGLRQVGAGIALGAAVTAPAAAYMPEVAAAKVALGKSAQASQAPAGKDLRTAAAPGVPIDSRPPLSAASSTSAASNATYNITINAAPGAAVQDIAQLVRAEIERIERDRQARTRSRLGDYGN